MPSRSPDEARKRGRETQAFVAAWFRGHGWPWATSKGSFANGVDVENMPGLSPEVKGTAKESLTGALIQAHRNRGTGLPFVVYRPNGYGAGRIEEWLVVMRLDDATALLRQAGYGDPEEEEASA
jgi:hypothetical protein